MKCRENPTGTLQAALNPTNSKTGVKCHSMSVNQFSPCLEHILHMILAVGREGITQALALVG